MEFHVTSVERLQGANQHLEDQLAGFKRMVSECDFLLFVTCTYMLQHECVLFVKVFTQGPYLTLSKRGRKKNGKRGHF